MQRSKQAGSGHAHILRGSQRFCDTRTPSAHHSPSWPSGCSLSSIHSPFLREAPAASSPNAASAFSSWVSTQVSTWGGLLRAHYSCADCLTHPLPRKSSPARQRLTLR